MGKLVAIETYDRFISLLESSGISERSLNFILDTGQLYTHGIFFNVVTFGTSTELYVPLNIAGTTKNLSLAGHTHSNYYAKNNDIDIGNSKIVSGLSDIIKYINNSIEIGNSSNPTYFYGTLKTTKNNTEYTILDTGNFSIEEKTVSGIMLQNVTTFKYGNTNYLMDYVKRLNVINTLDNIATHTNMGTTNENSVPYGFLTMYTDGELINPKYALLRINITTGNVEVRSSGNTTWRSLISSQSLPSIFGKSGSNASSGLVPSPGNVEGTTKFLCEDGTWKLPDYTTDTWREIKVNGTLKRSTSNSSGDLDFINGSNTTVEWTLENKLKINSTWIAWAGATDLTNGTAGYMPAPTSTLREQFLRGDGSWVSLNNYSLPKATTSDLGGIIVSNVLTTAVILTSSNGTTANRYYGVQLDKDGKAFVNIPWVWNAFTAASSSAAGTAGYIQAPAGALNKFFRGDNTWQEIAQNVTSSIYFGASNGTLNAEIATTPYLIFKEGSSYTRYKLEGAGGITVSSDASGNLKFTGATYSVFTGASSSAAGSAGLVKQPAAGDQEKFLRGDCTWQSITPNVTTSLYIGASNGTSTTALSTNGDVYLILKEGASYTRYNIVGSGRASVTSDANGKITINSSGYSNFGAATASAAGSTGLVPAPGANILGSSGYYLRADGTWAVPTNTWNAANNSQAGYIPKLTTGGGTIATQSTEYVLTFASGGTGTITPTWKLLPTNAFANTWNLGSSSLAGYVPQATKNYFLHCNDSTGALEWVANPNTNTWRNIYVKGSSKIGTGTSTKAINFAAGSNVSITYEAAGTEEGQSGSANYFNIKIAATDTWTAWKGATSSAAGTAGYMPAPTSAQRNLFLRGDGSWVSLNNYSLPTASDSTLGGIKVGTNLSISDGVLSASNNEVTGTLTEPTSATSYYPLLATSIATATTTAIKTTGYAFYTSEGTESAEGRARLYLGNSTATGTAGNKTGAILMYNDKGKYAYIVPHVGDTSNRTLQTPKATGTLVAHTTDTQIGSTTQPVYITAAGVATAIGHTIEEDVPSGAKFTDTTYSAGTKALYDAGSNTTNRVWSAAVLKSIGDTYLPLAGGTMSNTNVVTNLNADLLDGLHESSFGRKFSKTVAASAGVKITFTDECSAIIFGRGTSAIATRIVIIGNAYNTYSQWVCLEKGSGVTWCKVADSRDIELMNNSSGNLYISVLMGRGTVTFTDITALSATAVTDVMAMVSSNVASATKATQDGSGNVITSTYYSAIVSRTANTVLAAPNGSDGAATFRKLVAADIPSLAASKITSGTFAVARIPTLSYVDTIGTSGNTLTWSKGGTALTAITIPYATSAGSTPNLSSTTTKTYTGISYHAGSDGALNSTTARNWAIPQEATADYSYKNVQILRLGWTGNTYSTDILTSPNAHGTSTGLFYRLLVNGSYATPTGSYHGGWRMILDSCNYKQYCLPKSGGTLTGSLTLSYATSATMTAASTNPKITFSESDGTQPVHLTYTDYDSYRYPAGLKVVGGNSASPAWFEAEGDMYAANFYTTSDRNKKQNISSFSEHIRKFQLKDTEKWHYGIVALEVPEMFREGEEGNYTVNYNSLLSYYIGQLENKVKELENKVKQLENNGININ